MRASRIAVPLVAFAALSVAGTLLDRLAAPVWREARARQPALRLDSRAAATGQGITLALLGGFRALVADGLWLRLYAVWEQRDLAATDTFARLVTNVDPRPVCFWLNGARMIAYDLALWRVEREGGYDAVPAAAQQRIHEEQGRSALEHLALAMQFHPASADLWIERGNIELNRLRDPLAAAASYRRAWEQPNAPYYAARLHAEMLRRGGRPAEALAFLVQLHPTLPPGDEGAAADVVLGRIRDLERQLGVPAERAYRAR